MSENTWDINHGDLTHKHGESTHGDVQTSPFLVVHNGTGLLNVCDIYIYIHMIIYIITYVCRWDYKNVE